MSVTTDAEAMRLSVERVVEMEEFWHVMKNSRVVLTSVVGRTA